MAIRECGDCTACCEGWVTGDIEGQRMSPGVPCQHCTQTGCAIYERRPVEPCREFVCAWLMQPSPLPDDMRPDKCGAIVKWKQKWKKWWIMHVLPTGEEIPQATLERLIPIARQARMPMLMVRNEFEGSKCVGHFEQGFGPPDFLEAVKNNEEASGEMLK